MTRTFGAILAMAALLVLFATAAPEAQAQGARLDMSRHPVCAGYGRHAAMYERGAMAQGCRLNFGRQLLTFGANETKAYNWCMRTSDVSFRGRSPVAGGHKASLERLCGQQQRRPFRL